MNEALLIWGYLALGDFLVLSSWLFIIAVVANLMSFPVIFESTDTKETEEAYCRVAKKALKYTIPLAIVFWSVHALYPSKDDLKYIIGGALVWNGIEYASDIEGVDKLPENLVGSMNHFLESLQEEETE